MPRVTIPEAAAGIGTLQGIPDREKPAGGAARRSQFALLESDPDIGRPLEDLPELRELIIAFGDAGYVALYRHELEIDAVYVLAFRHRKEVGY